MRAHVDVRSIFLSRLIDVVFLLFSGLATIFIIQEDYTYLSTLLVWIVATSLVALRPDNVLPVALFSVPVAYFTKIMQYYASGGAMTGPYPVNLTSSIAILVGFAGLLLKTRTTRGWDWLLGGNLISRLFTILVIWAALEIFNPRTDLVTGVYGFKTFGVPLLMFYVGKYYAREQTSFKRGLKIVLAFLLVGSGYGFLQSLNGGSFPFEDRWIRAVTAEKSAASRLLLGGEGTISFYRISSFFGTFAVFAISLWIWVAIYALPMLKEGAGFAVVWLGVSLFSLWHTLSRTNGIALLVVVVTLWVLSISRKQLRWSALGILLIACLGAWLFAHTFRNLPGIAQDRIIELDPERIFTTNNNLTSRAVIPRILRLDTYSFALGNGSGTVGESAVQRTIYDVMGDSAYYALIAQYGIVGLFLVSAIFVTAGVRAVRRFIKEKNLELVQFHQGIVAICSASLVVMVPNDLPFYPEVSNILWFLLGLFAAI
ncbi:hypothetical protein HYR99_00265 [Candidatus Poribacteria bacterium]|nr:hypothetical protein [Candidatus Poribacteria bacterium]